MKLFITCSNCEEKIQIISENTKLDKGVNINLVCQKCSQKKLSLDRTLILVCQRCSNVRQVKKDEIFNSCCDRCNKTIYKVDLDSEMVTSNHTDGDSKKDNETKEPDNTTNDNNEIVDDKEKENESDISCDKCQMSKLEEDCPFTPVHSPICRERFIPIVDIKEDDEDNIIDENDDIIKDEKKDETKTIKCDTCSKYKIKKKKCKKNCIPDSEACNKHYQEKMKRKK